MSKDQGLQAELEDHAQQMAALVLQIAKMPSFIRPRSLKPALQRIHDWTHWVAEQERLDLHAGLGQRPSEDVAPEVAEEAVQAHQDVPELLAGLDLDQRSEDEIPGSESGLQG